jgi:phosphoribosylformylglycinamidine synthase
MGSIVVDVMLKPEILDPQGQAVGGALPRLGFEGFTDVRQGKRFVLTVDGDVTEEHLAAAREAADTLLSNPVIEDVVSVHVLEGSEGAADADGAGAAAPSAANDDKADKDTEADDEADAGETDGDVASEDESK